jgi:hypothetical protein
MKSILSKAAAAAVIASFFAINVQAGTVHASVADTSKMGKMSKMDNKMGKMDHKKNKMKKGKMGKDTTKM